MSFRRRCIRWIDSFISLAVLLAILLAGTYSGYALWDNNQVYRAAENVQLEMKKLKPVITEDEEAGPSFRDLLAINPDVCGWVTLDGTNIDYPILQGESNLDYINKDVYGNFALAGSIFMDCRNHPDFSDRYNLLFGHHMVNHLMFGDLDLYKENAFFQKNTTGTLITEKCVYDLKIIACLVVSASDEGIFNVPDCQDTQTVLAYARQEALHFRPLSEESEEAPRILALSTCTSEYTDARTIVLAVMHRH